MDGPVTHMHNVITTYTNTSVNKGLVSNIQPTGPNRAKLAPQRVQSSPRDGSLKHQFDSMCIRPVK